MHYLRSADCLLKIRSNWLCLGVMMEKAMATHSSTLALKILWTEEPGRLQSRGSQSPTGLREFTFNPVLWGMFVSEIPVRPLTIQLLI